MGFLGLFGKGPLSEAKIGKIAKLAANPYAQPDVRMREMQRLLADGSDAALRGVLKRFASNASGHIADEDEKKWLEDELVDFGEPALKPLEAYIEREKQLTYACRAYRRIAGDAGAARFFLKALEAYGPDDHLSIESKEQLVAQLSELARSPGVLAGLAPFIEDHSDEVRWATLEAFDRMADAMDDGGRTLAAARLANLVTSKDTGPRILARAAALLEARGWPLPESVETLAPGLEDGYFLDKKKFMRKRAKPSK